MILGTLQYIRDNRLLRQQNSWDSKLSKRCQVPVAHTCNPSYSGGRDQEDCSLKPAQANTSYLENTHCKKCWQSGSEWLKVKALSSSPSIAKKKKKENSNIKPKYGQ
jgi:hypothetical protein